MAEINELQKLKEEYPEFFKNVPSKVIEFILSEETTSKITDICKKNGIAELENIEGVAYRVALVLLSRLPKENLAYTIEKGVGLSPDVAKRISEEMNRLIFSLAPPPETEKTAMIPTAPEQKEETPEAKPTETEKITSPIKEGPPKEESSRPRGKDAYHEPIV